MDSVFPFVGAIGIALVFACHGGDDRYRRTAVLLLLNWVACFLAIMVSGSKAPWLLLLAIDAVTLRCVLRPAGKVQAVIAGLLFGQVLWHAAFGYVNNPAATRLYLTALNAGGWVQVGTLIGGAGYDQGRRLAATCWGRLFRRPGAAYDLARVDIEP
jgi:hypothetical protein